ncbi:hypothetical protein [Silanimonas sp.]|jgi:hypothetical protein|uniref:hypothetical protein n=1 Tax=Silanimonas sp. TaxID=1929290 RepID=UPI0037CA7B07
MSTPFPPPPAAPEKKRKLWPWFLGGCLTLLVVGGLAIAAMFYFGAKAVSAGGKEIVSQVPAVQEHFGAVTEAGMDFGAMMEASQAGQSVMIFNITGEKGEGRLVIETDQATQAFKSATLTLPSGETLEVDAATMKQLQALQP